MFDEGLTRNIPAFSRFFDAILEVDFILGGGEVAIEVKGGSRIDSRDLRPLRTFKDLYAPRKALVVCNEKNERIVGDIRIIPWRKFLFDLWADRIIH